MVMVDDRDVFAHTLYTQGKGISGGKDLAIAAGAERWGEE
jgi:hypothetical protein